MQECEAKDNFEGSRPQEVLNPGRVVEVKIYFVFIKLVCLPFIESTYNTCREVTQASCVESLLKLSCICITLPMITEPNYGCSHAEEGRGSLSNARGGRRSRSCKVRK